MSHSVRESETKCLTRFAEVRRTIFVDALDCRHVSFHDLRYTVTESELKAFIDRLATLAPSSRASEKRRLLESNSAAILALYRRGHSWSSIARELSAASGERISADLLRAACNKRAPKRRANVANERAAKALKPAPNPMPAPQAPPTSGGERFGAKGLKL